MEGDKGEARRENRMKNVRKKFRQDRKKGDPIFNVSPAAMLIILQASEI